MKNKELYGFAKKYSKSIRNFDTIDKDSTLQIDKPVTIIINGKKVVTPPVATWCRRLTTNELVIVTKNNKVYHASCAI